jgi:hypothetical protein
MFAELIKTIINIGTCPTEWKGARTILLYKRGNKADPGNWRPITITSILYTIIFCRIAQTIHHAYDASNVTLCGPDQKGFLPKRAGCTEHTAVENMIINDAKMKKKNLFILSLDLRDAFGSIPHDLMKINMKKVGIPKPIRKAVMNTYEEAFIDVLTRRGETDNILIDKGVKQRCPLRPTLFNLEIDPSLRYLNKNFKDLGYGLQMVNDIERRVVQAYADDLLIFTETRENLNKLTDAIADFMDYVQIHFNPDKCRIITHNDDKGIESELYLKDENGQDKPVKRSEINEIVKF